MELWHWILEHLPKSGELGEFFSENAPLIAGVCAIVFTLFEVIGTVWKRRGHKSHGIFELVRVFGLMVSILLATSIGLYTIQTKWTRKPAEIVWKEQVERSLQKCIEKVETPAIRQIDQALRANYETARLHCLAHAIQRNRAAYRAGADQSPAASSFRTQIKYADALLSIPGVSTILGRSFSIGEEFLGYGYSQPARSNRYSDAAIHEYLIRNRCATWSEKRCADPAQIEKQLFTWTMDASELAEKPSQKIGELIEGHQPNSREQAQDSPEAKLAFTVHLKAIREHGRLKSSPPVLIRFAKFPRSQYVGTVGRPDATYVFFSNLDEVWNKTINDADDESGRPKSAPPASAGLTFFIWLYFPSGNDEARLASWDTVMYFLDREIKVDHEIAHLDE